VRVSALVLERLESCDGLYIYGYNGKYLCQGATYLDKGKVHIRLVSNCVIIISEGLKLWGIGNI